jgi:GR25 family glycosyltransferase involved in LPS biosynthesis
LSHFNLLKKIKKTNKIGYTIVFEDDFYIVSYTFMKDVNNILKKMSDFDIIMLGNLNNNKGINITDNIYNIDNNRPLWGTHGYIVNNKNINKILETIKYVDMPIDIKYETLGKSKSLKIFVINPTIVNQQDQKLGSTINIEGFLSNIFSNKYYVFE